MTDSNKTRVLLALWALGGTKQEVKRGDLTKRIVSKGKKIADYHGIFKQLEQENAIAISRKSFSLVSPKGVEMLGEGLKNPDFEFEGTIVGTWAANALLRWIGEIESSVNSAPAPQNGKSLNNAIASYKEFEQVALEVYENLNRDYNLNNLVPIYRIRREIGDRVSRKQFSEWLLEMQAEDIFQLEGGSVEDSAADKIEDSITTELDGLRCYASKLQN
ncbi:hypothetical protein IQ247_27580 [Plectonema cf. radiosum LEGE 06105]|uniref:Uncharacterized protein n=1 Tax=Plectonema cf. radiosum LEGE 06105 TaxID=945769 RepID=A0A8J7FD68_9CYAN|nr:hypothetical protein [Plectonema radiosum]MBE9216379.1 hypothetical protein [Plectonema cf. radiosum LEGE 06105]